MTKFNLNSNYIKDYKFSDKSNEIEKKIYKVRNNDFDIFENGENYVIYRIDNLSKKKPDINDAQTKKEILKLVVQKNKFDYNRKLLQQIRNGEFTQNNFLNFGEDKIQPFTLNSIKDNNKFEINSVQMLYSLPINSFTLINDEGGSIYLAKVKNYDDVNLQLKANEYDQFSSKENTRIRNNILKSYDLFLNKKYNVNVNQVALNNIKNLFQ